MLVAATLAVAAAGVPAESRGLSGREVPTDDTNPIVNRETRVFYHFDYRSEPSVGTIISVTRDGVLTFTSVPSGRDRYFCLGQRPLRRLLGDARRAVQALPRDQIGRPLFGMTFQHLELFADSVRADKRQSGRYLRYLATSQDAREPPLRLRELMRRLHILLQTHRPESIRVPRDGKTRC